MNETSEVQKQFSIQKLYVKDASFESPASPRSFKFQEWNPKIDLNLTNNQKLFEGDIYEVVLSITVTVSQEDITAYLVEVHQAGLFEIGGFDDDQKNYLLGSQCMNILFPYAREVVTNLSVRGGFPPLILSPVNFEALYQQHLQQKQEKQAEAEAEVEAKH
ncbi:MAG: protein-export chaperone SecB [Gammaproteobacteria bacterium]|nr:protein-export chaperone SecB [Gammaproteobacteria bacterium]